MKIACLRDTWTPESARRGAGGPALVAVIAALCSLAPGSARAIDAGLCNNDGVTEVPSFAEGRDANQCLLIDPGNGDPDVLFQYDHLHKTGDQTSISGFNANCPTEDSNIGCTYMIWDTVLDNYNRQAMANEDVWKTSIRAEYLYIKDTKFINGWKCEGNAWSGPNGIGCSSQESSAHSDGIQMRRNPVDGGWVVFQDSVLSNAFNATCRFTDPPLFGAAGSFMFQGFQLGQFTTPLGESTNYVQECKARGGSDDICETNACIISYGGDAGANQMWFIDVWGSTPVQLSTDVRKTVLVNTGCGRNGCNGTIEYVNGWPWPMDAAERGPGTCPNGLVKQSPTKAGSASAATFCYTSVERALNDSATSTSNQGDCPAPYCPHKPPPFIHLSATGWESPPSGTSTRPAAPQLLP